MEANLYIALVAVQSYLTRVVWVIASVNAQASLTRVVWVIASVNAQASLRVSLKVLHLLGDSYTYSPTTVWHKALTRLGPVSGQKHACLGCRCWGLPG